MGDTATASRGSRRRPFARAEQWTRGWFAVSRRGGICSGPWDTEEEAAKVVRAWNEATG